uniref:Uncharacterized protein n=1 Tax=Coccolithus braarudii TaxID=221442 RepID=A0A7S0LPI8_9EUKA
MLALVFQATALAAHVAPLSSRSVIQSRAPTLGVTMAANKKVWSYEGVDGDVLFEGREVDFGRPPVKLLSRIEELKVATTVSELGLLSFAEENGVFSTLENAGAFSTAEKLLPVIEELGVLSLLESTLDVDAGLIFTVANYLLVVTPAYGALAICGFAPIPEGPFIVIDALVAAGLLTSGVLVWAWAFAVSKLQED